MFISQLTSTSTFRELHFGEIIHISRCYCCDRKSRAAYAKSFALWQQATIEFTCHDHSPRMLVVTFNRSHARIIRDYTPRSLSSSPFASTSNCSPGSQALLEVTHQDHSIGITLLLLVRTTYIYYCSSRTPRSW